MNLKFIRRRIFIIAGIICLLCFYIFSQQVKNGFMKSVDFAVTVKIQDRIDNSTRLRFVEFVGNVMEGSTFFAGPEFSVVVLLLLTGILCIDSKNKKFHIPGLLFPLFFCFLVSLEIYGKTVIHHPAPPFFMIKNPTSIFPKYYINDLFSYPSGHVARAIFLGLSLYSLFRSNRSKGIFSLGVFVYVFLVATSRIYLGHHWFSDITGGLLLGFSLWSLCWGVYGLLTRAQSSHIIPKQ
jgi:membrane-associated phospholipid phosphatase